MDRDDVLHVTGIAIAGQGCCRSLMVVPVPEGDGPGTRQLESVAPRLPMLSPLW
jgi:hypothetical protein